MLSKLTKVCPRCSKSRETYYVVEKDLKKKGKSWRIERCISCAYNFEIEEAPAAPKNEDEPKKEAEEPKSRYWGTGSGWRI